MLLHEHRAAQYVRMSTDLQRHSIDNQSDAIALYAAQRGLTIVRSYEDAGRSGLGLDGRVALQNLLSDVRSGRADFRTILVYDVSRWGRFQDSDESAHYEYLCRRAGVAVEYCAEQFENDGSLTTAVLKNIKRAMAGEFSRELSVKVFAGQRQLTLSGFHVGATPGYGLRRVLLDENGNRKTELAFGQRKSLQSERVVLVPGPPEEVRTVHRAYELFIDEKQSPFDIARQLNIEGTPAQFGRSWTRLSVLGLLSNEKYMGNAVYNRTSKKLNCNWRRNPGHEWIRGVGAYEAIVSQERFDQARKRLADIARVRTENDLLDLLTALWCRHGHLSTALVEAAPHVPGAVAYARRFGSIAKAFRLIGFRNRENIGTNADLRKAIIKDVVEQVTKRGGYVETSPWNKQLIINGEMKVNILISRLKSTGPKIWQFGYVSQSKPDILIGARIAERTGPIVDYFILPFMLLPHGSWVTASVSSGLRLERFRSETLEPFYNLCSRVPLKGSKW